jgi:hypothetical protein
VAFFVKENKGRFRLTRPASSKIIRMLHAPPAAVIATKTQGAD